MFSWENEQRKEHISKFPKVIGEKHYSDTR